MEQNFPQILEQISLVDTEKRYFRRILAINGEKKQNLFHRRHWSYILQMIWLKLIITETDSQHTPVSLSFV